MLTEVSTSADTPDVWRRSLSPTAQKPRQHSAPDWLGRLSKTMSAGLPVTLPPLAIQGDIASAKFAHSAQPARTAQYDPKLLDELQRRVPDDFRATR
jgi:hypothetical protein